MTDDTTTRGEKSVDYKEKVPTYLSSSNKENMFIHIYKSFCACVRACVDLLNKLNIIQIFTK